MRGGKASLLDTKSWRARVVFCLTVGAALAALEARAQTSATWTGLADDFLWNTGGNWTGGVRPGTALGDIAIFDSGGTPTLSGQIVTIGAPITLGRITSVGSGAPVAFTISGGVILFDNGASAAQLQFGGNDSLTIASALSLNSDLSLNGASAISRLTLSGAITGAHNVAKSGVGTAVFLGGGKTFSGGFDIFAGLVESAVANAANSTMTLGAVDSVNNYLGAGNLRVGNAGTVLDIMSSGGASASQTVSLNGSRLTAEFGGVIRLSEQDSRNALTLNLNGGTLDGGTNANRGTLYLSGADLAYNVNGLGGTTVVNTPSVVFDTSANTTAMTVTLNGGTLTGLGAVRKVGANDLNFIDTGTFGAAQFSVESGRTAFGTATLNLTSGLVFADQTPITNLLLPTGRAVFGKANQMAAGGNNLSTVAGATGTLALGGFDQTFGTISLAANSRLNIAMQPVAAVPTNLAIGTLTGTGLSIFGWRGNPATHIPDGSATITDNVTFGAANLANVWFRGFDPGAVLGTDGILRPTDFLHTGWTGAAGAVAGSTFRWFDVANWSVDVPVNRAGATATFAPLANVVASLESQTVPLGHLVTNSTGKLTIGTGTLVFDSGVTGVASTITGTGNVTINAPIELHNDLIVNTGAADSVYVFTGAGNIAVNGGGLTLTAASPAYTGDLTVNAGRLTFNNAQGLGPDTNTLHMNGGEVYAGSNTLNVKTITNKVTFDGDFTAGLIEFGYTGNVSWTGTRTITGDSIVNFGQGLRLTGTGALVVQGGATSGFFDFGNNSNDFSGGLTVKPRLGYGTGGANATLRTNLVTGALSPGENYFGTGPIVATAPITVATNGFSSTLRGALSLGNGADAIFSGGGSVTLAAGATLTRTDATATDLVVDGSLAINGATLVGSPNIVSNPAQGTTKTITSTGSITGVGAFTKTLGGATILNAPLAAGTYTINGGIFVLGGSVINGTSKMFVSGASIHSRGGTAGAPVTNKFGDLQLDGNASINVEDHSAVTFTKGIWTTGVGRSLLIQNSNGIWSTAAQPTLSDTYVRFTNTASSLSAAQLLEVAFTGFDRGASLVLQNVGGTNYWFLAPTGQPLTEWRGAGGLGQPDTDRLWSTGTNWLGGVSPNAAGAVAAVRALDSKLPNNVIIVDAPVTLGKLLIERGPSTFEIKSQGSGVITFDNNAADAQISVANDNGAVLSSDIFLPATKTLALRHLGTQIFTLASKISGGGGIVSNYAGPGTATLPDAGIIRFDGNAAGSDYTGGFWLRGSPGNNVALDRGAREIRIATDGTLFGAGTDTGDPATSTQALRIGESSVAGGNALGWYRIAGEGGARTVNASVRFDGNLYHVAPDGLTIQSSASSYVTAGLKQISSASGSMLTLDTPIAGPGGFQFGASNQVVNFLRANTFSGGTLFLSSYSPVIGIGADDALGTGTITYQNVNVGNNPTISALGGARSLSNQFVFQSPVGTAKITAQFIGNLTFNHNGRSQLINSPGIVVNAGSTAVFTSTHILEGPAGLIKNGTGTLRLEAANEYLGDTDLVQGVLQVGNDQALGTTGRLIFSDATKIGTLASFGGARTLTNQVLLNAPTFGLDGTLGTLTLNPDAALGATVLAGARTANVSGTAVFGANLNLTGAGSLKKAGDGTLVLTNGDSSYSGGTTVTRGTLQVNAPAGDVTLGRAEAGQNYLGTGAISVGPTTASAGVESRLEILVADGASVHIGGNVVVTGVALGPAALDITSTANAVPVTGANIKTYLDATQTISGNSFGTFRTPGDLIKTGGGTTTTITGGVLDTRNLVIDSGTFAFGASGLASQIQNLTMGNGTLMMSQSQTFAAGSQLRLAGIGTVNMAGSSGFLTLGTVGSWDPAGELTISNWNGTTGTGGGVEQFRFASDVTGLFTDAMLSSVIFEGLPGTSYAPGAVVVPNSQGFFELLPVGTTAEWDHGGSGYNWSTAQNWQPDNQPNGVGASAAFGDLDPALNGKSVTVDTAVTLGSLVVSNTLGAAFTLSGAPITFQQASATANAVISVTGNSSPTLASNLDLRNNLLVSHRGTGVVTVSGVLSGIGKSVIKSGPGTLVLTGANTYTGGTEFLEGVLVAGADRSLGGASGALSFDGGTLKFGSSFDLAGTRAINLGPGPGPGPGLGGGAIDTDIYNTRIGQGITGPGGLTKLGAGTLTLAGANTYAGDTRISAGTLQIGDGGTTGSVVGNIVDNSALILNHSSTFTFSGAISGTGTLTHAGTGLTTLTGDLTHSGGTTISQGTLQIGDGGTAGTIAGNIVDNGALVFNRSDAITFGGGVSGSGTLTQQGSGILALTGASTYTGATTVSAGTLQVDGSLGNTATTVQSGATLSGIGSIAGPVTVLGGGHIAPGDSPGTLSVGTLTLNAGSILDYELNTPNVVGGASNDLLLVNGDLTLNGTLNISTADPIGLLPGSYRLIGYTGVLTNAGGTLAFGTIPDGFTPNVHLFIQTSVTQQVNLINAKPPVPLVFWDSDDPAQFDNGSVDGGNGTWLSAPGNQAWTNVTGGTNSSWLANGFAVFEGTPGTVTVDQSSGAVTFGGAQFAVSGYRITGQSLTTDLPETFLRVGDGTDAGAAFIATIDSVIAGTGGIHKVDLGTLVLAGLNTYTGGTTIRGGTLSIATDLNLGDAAGGLTFNGGTLLTTADVTTARIVTLESAGGTIDNGGNTDTFSGVFSGDGGLTAAGTGTLILTGDNLSTGDTTISAGTLQLGDGGTTGSIFGNVVDHGALVFNRSDAVTYAGVISGTGTVTQASAGVLTLTGDSTYTGDTTISAGTLQLGDGGTSGSILGSVVDNGALVFNRSDAVTYAGVISGTGTMTQAGAGSLILTGDST
ncbi:MAG TPA: autotransporter-associated beta strand repeat-containing protein, partial [Steroidobacteraceae bacterium]|nr:autotransporter-associated beta strand repeat-containing protein [Steroidobacteraceae bacterium]